jgi:AcrR family transcriptional regulator
MPRIAAASIDEHVRIQNERIRVAARQLFGRQGFTATDMGQIASAMGLARNSLYRYYSSKDHILLACIREDMEPHLQRLESLANDYPNPSIRIMVWLDMQFELATGPAHATMELMGEVRDASVKLGNDVRRLHEAPNAALAIALAELPGEQADSETLAAMIGGMVLAATSLALRLDKAKRPGVCNELKAAVGCLIDRP